MMVGLFSLLVMLLLSSCTTMADARIEQARYEAQTAQVQAQEQTKRETEWLRVLPVLLLIVVAGGGVYMAGWYWGRLRIIQVEAQEARRTLMLTGTTMPQAVAQACLQYDATAQPDPSYPGAWIVTMAQTGKRVRMLPPPRLGE